MTNNNTPSFIDFEASSLDLIAGYPIEVGVCLPDGRAESWLIRPHGTWRDWSDSAEQIHGISRQQLEEEGIPVRQVADHLNRLLTDVVYCDAWTFDSFWLHRLFRAAGYPIGFQLDSVSSLLNPLQVRLWPEVRREIIQSGNLKTHRAASDALILRKTWDRVMDFSRSQTG